MFSGIIEGLGEVTEAIKNEGLTTFSVKLPFSAKKIKRGSSISIDGVCLTAVKIDDSVYFDVMKETLNKTTLKKLEVGRKVNIEKSIKVGDEIGGHLISGHIDCEAEIVKTERPENNHIITFRVDRKWMKYILPKGFIALDGASLTVVDVFKEGGEFTVYFIPETLKLTTFGFKKEGDIVNLEIDRQTQAIVDTVENILNKGN